MAAWMADHVIGLGALETMCCRHARKEAPSGSGGGSGKACAAATAKCRLLKSTAWPEKSSLTSKSASGRSCSAVNSPVKACSRSCGCCTPPRAWHQGTKYWATRKRRKEGRRT